ncbi:MAG TPA: DNA polymerase III subunit epsilon [Devosia sp.]|nr:DNA polymerase III subunit epsilon [Devosia sp.]
MSINREIVLDTETTGLSPQTGDRIVEIGCVELVNHLPTGKSYHTYINPERDMPEGAFRVHGLSEEFLAEKPLFSEIAGEFSRFIGDSTLIIHNAPFDMGFLNAEFERLQRPFLRNPVIDTVQLARENHPGARVSLDALCKIYGIDNSRRALHGALLDSEILAEVYLELIGGRQTGLSLSSTNTRPAQSTARTQHGPRPNRIASVLSDEQITAHKKLLESLDKKPIWAKYAE